MKIEGLNKKINRVIVTIFILFIVGCIIVGYKFHKTDTHIDTVECIMGGSCPEINSILPDKISEVLDRDGLKLICKEYEQIPVTKFNTTCSFLSCFLQPCNERDRSYDSYIDDKETDCGWGRKESVKAVIVNINGECLKYEIVKK